MVAPTNMRWHARRLTGAPPFQNSNPAIVIGQHLSAVPPQISDHRRDLAALNPVFARAMAKQPAARFDRCLDFATALVHSGAGIPATDGPTALDITRPAPKSTKEASEAGPQRRRRSMWWAAAIAGGVVALLVAIDKPPMPVPPQRVVTVTAPPVTVTPQTPVEVDQRYQKGMKFVR